MLSAAAYDASAGAFSTRNLKRSSQKYFIPQADCPDESDENDCELMTIPESYRPNIPPRSLQSNAAYPVSLHVSVLALEILTEKMEIVMDFEVTLQWLDRRLVFNDLNEDSVINALRLGHLKKLWIPEVC